MSLDSLKEKALANFEILLHFWGLDYKKITEYEYDIIAKWRKDDNYGGCRFNLEKARGADFAGGSISIEDITNLNLPFDKEDYAGFSQIGQAKIGFDIIGLAQRVHKCITYKEGAKFLNQDLETISKHRKLFTPSVDSKLRREKEQKNKEKRIKQYANDLWESCKNHKFEGSIGAKYLTNRGINVRDNNIRFHPCIQYSPTRQNFPALLFKVQNNPTGPLIAIHRIYLDNNGTKAKIDNPKMALAPIKGAAIWFGEPRNLLALTEGPENALTLRELGYGFVASSIYGTNLHNIIIPSFVKKLTIFPDVDVPGLAAFERAKEVYSKLNIEVEGYLLPKGDLDLNDLLQESTNG